VVDNPVCVEAFTALAGMELLSKMNPKIKSYIRNQKKDNFENKQQLFCDKPIPMNLIF